MAKVKTYKLDMDKAEEMEGSFIGELRILNKKADRKISGGRVTIVSVEVMEQWDGTEWKEVEDAYEEGW